MFNYDWIGYLAMLVTIISFVPKEIKLIRILNSNACVLWIIYGILIDNTPTVMVNVIVLIIHLIWFYDEDSKNSV